MKHIVILLFLINNLPALGQEEANKFLFTAGNKLPAYYVDLNNSDGRVYEIGKYLDKAGSGYSIRTMDTVVKQADGNFTGKKTKVIFENNKLYLAAGSKKVKKIPLNTVKDVSVANMKLNNAYYLDHYFEISSELSRKYPLGYHSFRSGFRSWEEIPGKDIDHQKFIKLADQRLAMIKDSITSEQDNYVSTTNFIIQNIKTLDYRSLKENLVKLPAVWVAFPGYYGTVINEVAKQRPEYYFSLAEDFPNNRNLIFFAVDRNKETVAGLKAVEGHAETKKAFFKK